MHDPLNVKYMNSCIGNNVSFIRLDIIAAALCNFKYVYYYSRKRN